MVKMVMVMVVIISMVATVRNREEGDWESGIGNLEALLGAKTASVKGECRGSDGSGGNSKGEKSVKDEGLKDFGIWCLGWCRYA